MTEKRYLKNPLTGRRILEGGPTHRLLSYRGKLEAARELGPEHARRAETIYTHPDIFPMIVRYAASTTAQTVGSLLRTSKRTKRLVEPLLSVDLRTHLLVEKYMALQNKATDPWERRGKAVKRVVELAEEDRVETFSVLLRDYGYSFLSALISRGKVSSTAKRLLQEMNAHRCLTTFDVLRYLYADFRRMGSIPADFSGRSLNYCTVSAAIFRFPSSDHPLPTDYRMRDNASVSSAPDRGYGFIPSLNPDKPQTVYLFPCDLVVNRWTISLSSGRDRKRARFLRTGDFHAFSARRRSSRSAAPLLPSSVFSNLASVSITPPPSCDQQKQRIFSASSSQRSSPEYQESWTSPSSEAATDGTGVALRSSLARSSTARTNVFLGTVGSATVSA